MSLLSLVYGTKKHLKIAQIEVDVSVQETHETDCEISENPIERGSPVSDHVQLRPAVLTIEGLVSDTPIRFLAGVRRLFDDNRSRKTYEELLAIQAEREPIDVITGLKQYSNMILKTLTVPRSADTGKALRFTAVFQQVSILDSATISIAVSNPALKPKASLGKTATQPPPATAPDPGSQIWQAGGDFVQRFIN